jgi:hypothetical protein
MFPRSALISDFWRVNSYSYPNFFNKNKNSQEAWDTLLSFFNFKEYDTLKKYWASSDSPRTLSSHAVESWKATFEEFGLLYVATRSNRITITPAGMQLREAAGQDDQDEFAWIGLNLLLRYPLRGPRRQRSDAHGKSDLLLYKFLYAALLDLGGFIWWTELEQILCRVFQTRDGESAVLDILELRNNPTLRTKIDLPVSKEKKEGFYNSLNQVIVHAGMNHFLLEDFSAEPPYGITEAKRKTFIKNQWKGMVRQSLFLDQGVDQCLSGGAAVLRIPAAPDFEDEISFFDYLGARIAPMGDGATTPLQSVELHGDRVFILNEGEHYSRSSDNQIIGHINELCQIARGQRVILSHDKRWTYIVEDKGIVDATRVKVTVRPAKPYNIAVLRVLIGGDHV